MIGPLVPFFFLNLEPTSGTRLIHSTKGGAGGVASRTVMFPFAAVTCSGCHVNVKDFGVLLLTLGRTTVIH